jgi:hypothetical protein
VFLEAAVMIFQQRHLIIQIADHPLPHRAHARHSVVEVGGLSPFHDALLKDWDNPAHMVAQLLVALRLSDGWDTFTFERRQVQQCHAF